MPDRNDPSQYGGIPSSYDTFPGDTTMDDVQLKASPEIDYPTPDKLIEYIDPAQLHDYINDHPELFTTKFTGKLYPNAEYRQIPPVSSIMIVGDGYLSGFSVVNLDAANPVTFIMYDGLDTNANAIGGATLASGGAANQFWFPGGVRYYRGIYLSIITASTINPLRGSLFFADSTAQ